MSGVNSIPLISIVRNYGFFSLFPQQTKHIKKCILILEETDILKKPYTYNHPSKEIEARLLLDYYKHGNLDHLVELYEPYMHLVYGLCLKYLKQPEKSEDAVMQIFESLVKKLRIHQVENFRSWLYTVARNHCLMQLRAEGKDNVLINSNFMETADISHQDIDQDIKEAEYQRLEECIQQLKPEQQQAIRLFYLEEKCYQEISELTGFDLKKVKSHIQNGRRNLKICMEKN